MSSSRTYLEWLSQIPVSASEIRQALNECGEPNAAAGGFWGHSMTIGSLHPSSPAKANAILSRLEALFLTIPHGYQTGWTLRVPQHGVTLRSRYTLEAAANIPLQRRGEQMLFDRDAFVTRALQSRTDRQQTKSRDTGATEFCGETGA